MTNTSATEASNLLIVSGDQELAMAYAVHVLDVYDHYRFRAVGAELERKGKKGWSGFLETDDSWQDPYLGGQKGALAWRFDSGFLRILHASGSSRVEVGQFLVRPEADASVNVEAREPSGMPPPRYRSESRPWASGEKAMHPMPLRARVSSSPRSGARSNRL